MFLKDASWAGGVLTGIVIICTVLAAKTEETENILYFGDAYRNYMKRTKMFIPFLLWHGALISSWNRELDIQILLSSNAFRLPKNTQFSPQTWIPQKFGESDIGAAFVLSGHVGHL